MELPPLSELLRKPQRFWDAPSPRPDAVRSIETAARRVRERWPDVIATPSPHDAERVLQDLLDRHQGWSWKGCPLSRIAIGIQLVFDPSRQDRRDLDPLRFFLLDECRATTRPGLLSALMRAFLHSWAPGSNQTGILASVLRERERDLPRAEADLLTAAREILDLSEGHRAMAARMLRESDPFGFLRRLGFHAPHAPGITTAVHSEFVKLIAPRLGEGTTEEPARLLAWIAPAGHPAWDKAADAVSALLAPWSGSNPPNPVQSLILQGLTSAFGDPRIVRGGIWSGVPEELRRILWRWLAGQSLRAFLDIVSDAESSHMWSPRKTFWLQMFERGVISEAWVALSPRAEEIAKRRARQSGDDGLRSFGRQIAGGGRRETSLLIMVINGKVVVEGSHSYRVHVFPKNHPRAPRLYGQSYDCEDIRLSLSDEHKRVHDEPGNWRYWVQERLL